MGNKLNDARDENEKLECQILSDWQIRVGFQWCSDV